MHDTLKEINFPKTFPNTFVIPIAIRSGDYYMFDDLNDEPIELERIDTASDSDEDDDAAALRRKPSKKFTVGEVSLCHTILLCLLVHEHVY